MTDHAEPRYDAVWPLAPKHGAGDDGRFRYIIEIELVELRMNIEWRSGPLWQRICTNVPDGLVCPRFDQTAISPTGWKIVARVAGTTMRDPGL